MKITVTLALIFSLALGASLALTPTEQQSVDQLLTHHGELRALFVNALFGKALTPTPSQSFACNTCHSLISIVLGWVREGLPDDQIEASVKALCKTLDIVPADVCDDVVDQYVNELLFITKERPWLTRFDVCGILLGGGLEPDCRNVNETMTDWDVTIIGNKPPIFDRPFLPDDAPRTKVLHITDVHPDLHYVVGSLADCGNFLCCRPHANDDPSNTSISAGPWGDYRDCDMPVAGVEAIFDQAATEHADADFVIMTGDLTHHQIWNYTVADNIAHFNFVTDLLHEKFVGKTIYPVLGNHEPAPCNLFPTAAITARDPKYNISWVYDTLADAFQTSLTPEALTTFRAAGYYTLLHKPGFRIIALNTNFCYTLNFWLIHSPQDPEGQLQWFSDTLDQAENNNEVVWIIGHVPPGDDDCWFYWGGKYSSIIHRYESIIRAQFYGHTHNDDLKIFFDQTQDPPRPVSSLFITTSTTPYSYINPGYKVFYADGPSGNNTWDILDHEAWIYNVTEANLAGESVTPRIFREYSAKEEYGLRSFRPADLYDFVVSMVNDEVLFEKFNRFHQMSYGGECITVECRMERLCSIVNTDYANGNCDRLHAMINATAIVH